MMDFDKKHLFSIGLTDECILQWQVQVAKKNWELDYLNYEQNESYETQRVEAIRYFSMEQERLADRALISSMKSSLAGGSNSDYHLQLKKVFGRRGVTNKIPVLITSDNQLITSAGSLIITTKLPVFSEQLDSSFKLVQSIIDPDANTMFSQSPEVSAMVLCPRGIHLAIGVKQLDSILLIWNILTHSFIKKIALPGVIYIQSLRYCSSSQRLVVLGRLATDHCQALYLIDAEAGAILAFSLFPFSHLNRILGVNFYFESNYKFLTYGIQHASLWEYSGGMIYSEELPMYRVKDLMKNVKASEHLKLIDEERPEVELRQELIPIRTTFLCDLFVDQFFILGSEDGEVRILNQLVIFRNQNIVQVITAHQLIPILCLDLCVELKATHKDLSKLISKSRLLCIGFPRWIDHYVAAY